MPLGEVDEFLDSGLVQLVEAAVRKARDAGTLPDGPIDVRFDAVTFRYPEPGEHAADASGFVALRDVSVHLPAQHNIAVVGETGSGKTTFAKLLTRLMDPSEGTVLLSETPIDTVQFGNLRRRVVMVPQEGSLFGGTERIESVTDLTGNAGF